MELDELSAIVRPLLEDFYEHRLQKLNELKLNQTLRKKNPYLFRAAGVQKASEIVESILKAFMSSSEETIFGNCFFEPLAKHVCRGDYSNRYGMDIAIEDDDSYTVISVKSGPNWGNSSQIAKLEQDFRSSRSRFIQRNTKKQFKALLGHCYGRKKGEPTAKRSYAIRSGQVFWEILTSDPDFYTKLINSMGDLPYKHRLEYEEAWNKAVNRFQKEFDTNFVCDDGEIDWTKLAQFNSGAKLIKS